MPEFKKELKKLYGREKDFALCIIEGIVSNPMLEGLELDIAQDRLPNDSKELKEIISKLISLLGKVYTISHSFQPERSCHHVHDAWRSLAIKEYKELVDSNLCHDYFNLFQESRVTVDLKTFDSIWIYKPDTYESIEMLKPDRMKLETYRISNNTQEDGDFIKKIVLVESPKQDDKYFILESWSGDGGKVTHIPKEQIQALCAKTLLSE